jgi:hypothetical protein
MRLLAGLKVTLALGAAAGALSATPAQAAGPAPCSAYVRAEIYSVSGQVSTICAYANIGFTGGVTIS